MRAHDEQQRRKYCRDRAGYAEVDVPCQPSRSAYTDDTVGEGAYRLAQDKWNLYKQLCWETGITVHAAPVGKR